MSSRSENPDIQELAMDLLKADSEQAVVAILKRAGLWDNRNLWRLYGDKEGNFAQAGNQQALPEAALVEKIVNSCDARLMAECLVKGIDPESSDAPPTMRAAVARFFDNRPGHTDSCTLVDWPGAKRTEQARFITLAATGDRPTRGHRTRNMCLTIVDQGEGQSPARLPATVLSLNSKNKQRVPFVQGKFNMGGTGALRFCGSLGLQLVISRRRPELARLDEHRDGTVHQWAVTVVRREEPSNKSGEPIHSEFTYLAPVGAESEPRHGEVLRFDAPHLPLMPEHDEAYARKIDWGTAIKLYEYETTVGQSNVLFKDGLLFAIERLLPEIALPIRIHECRGYQGDKAHSFETTIAGLVVRLEEGKGDNLEPAFPHSVQMRVGAMNMSARVYAFKEARAETYLQDEGVVFMINGQAHGYLPKSIFTRPKAVGLPRLRDSLLVLVDCSALSITQREDLFMSSRDRLSKKPLRFEIEREIENMLHANPELRRLQQERREQDVGSRLSEEKPLEDVLGKIFSASPALKALFLMGQRLSRPFAAGGPNGNGDGQGPQGHAAPFQGRKHPTYFRLPDVQKGAVLARQCELGRRSRIAFETDVENEYFGRPVDRGSFDIEIIDSSLEMSPPNFSVSLEDGAAHLNVALPPEAAAGEELVLQCSVTDETLGEPFVNIVKIGVIPRQERPGGGSTPRRPHKGGGTGDAPTTQGISMPNVIPVHENDELWKKFRFDQFTAAHVISDPVDVDGMSRLEHTFYVNVDNVSLKTEMKYSKQDPRLIEAKFKYGNVLLGIALLHQAEKGGSLRANAAPENSDEGETKAEEKTSVQDIIREVSAGVAPVLVPMIDQLSGLSEELVGEVSSRGEDA